MYTFRKFRLSFVLISRMNSFQSAFSFNWNHETYPLYVGELGCWKIGKKAKPENAAQMNFGEFN